MKLFSILTRIKISKSEANLWFISIATAAIVFMTDLMLPLGVAGAIPYALVILVGLWSSDKRIFLIMAVICSVLTIIAFYLSPPGGELWKVIFNRSLAIFVIWTTAILALMWKVKDEQLNLVKNRLEKERIYFATLQGAEHIINNLLNQLQLVHMEATRHIEFDKETLVLFERMMSNASSLLKSLSEVKDIDEEAILKSVYQKSRNDSNGRIRTLEFRFL